MKQTNAGTFSTPEGPSTSTTAPTSKARTTPVDDGQVVVEYELGVASVSQTAGLTWPHVHDDITCRVAEIADDLDRLRCETSSIALALSDGHVRLDG